MKKIMLLLCVLLAGLTARAADPVVTIGDVKIMPGETVALSLNLTNDSPMKGFQLDIALPEGLSFVGTTANDVKAAGRLAALTGEDAFTIRKSIKASGALGIIAAYNGPTVQAGDGPIMTINVTCADATALAKLTGTIKGAKVKLESGNYTLTNTEFNVKVYKMFTVTATSSDATMGSVTGGGEYESGSEVTLTATPAEEGYSFVKWSDDVTDNPRVLTVNADATLTAVFKANAYKSTFVLGNGEENIVKTQDYKTALAAPDAPTWTGYTFKGWSPEVPATVPAEDKTYTAQWQINQYTMTFVLGNGEADIVKTQDYQTALEKPADPQREGYTFTGWDAEIPTTIPAENKTFTAQWQINQYTMTFVLGNGQENVVKTQDYGTELTAPANLQKTGYTFTGWDAEVPATVPAGNKTFTAQWQINQYTMTFILGNGQENIVKTQDYQTALTAPANPEREGYTFTGWDAEIPTTIPAENKTFTAQWQINQYKMTFKLENGEADVEKTQDYGSELTAPANLQKTGYTFTGWDAEVPATVPASDKTFTAQWEINQYTMTFVLGNGEENIVKTQDYQTALTAPANPEREGYTFTGWDAEIPTTIPAENKTFTAQWQINQYTMTFVLGNGEENVVKTQDYGTELTAPANLQKTGYTFTGWDAEVPATVPAGNKTFTAQWQINQYTMTFVLGNGQENIVKTQDYQTALTAPANPEREGYTFTGWDAEIPTTIPAENKTFTAQWQINQYTMTFVLGNGEENVVKTQDYGTELTAPANLQKTGYTFTGWDAEVPATVPVGDQTYTAQWQINQYTMTFVLGNGQENIVKTQDYQTALMAPANPEREGYTFTGWDAEIPTTIPAENKTFTAQWQINQYTMTFVLGNGEENVVKTQNYGTELTAPANLQKTGYTFTGWDAEVPATVPAGNKTFTAQWQINQYTMTFVLGNGQENIVKTQDYQTALTAPANPEREGYTFKGWDAEIPTTIPAENKTFTAQWQINQYTMTFVLGNGEENVVKTQNYGTELTAPANLQKTGYTFTGWDAEVPATVPAGNKTFTAQWQINQYTMTFVLGNGQENIVKTQDYQTALTAPANPEREGYTFTGWDAEIPTTIPAENKTFTAQWQVNKYKVTFIVDGQVVKEGEVEYGAAIEKPADPQKDTYTFIGWTPEVPVTMPASDMTFTAQFALNPYTMTFVLGNGEADIVKTQECGSALTPPADPTREGYTFMGWSPEVPANIPDHDMTFTAQWQINQYKMIFKLENGEADVEKTQDYGTELTAPANFVKTGYTFTGWTPEVPATVPAEDMTFTAQWRINQYTITFVLGNGEADIVKTQDYDSALEAPADPTREGYTFTGWDTEIPATVPAENKTFTAQWQVNKYKVTFIVDGQVVKEGEVEYGAAIEKPADPQKDTYTFIGWTPEVPATMPASDMTFTAQFALNPYTMTFVLGNGEADIVKTQECGSDLTPPADPTREGYTFTGWSPEVPATVPGEDMTFTAQWKVNQYAIIYMLNGQEWARDMVDYGTAITLREYTPVADETFSGWTFEDGETYTTMPAHDVTVIGSITTSIQDVLKNHESVDVYDLRGRLMRRNIPVSELRKVLRTGVYIINGRKVAIK